MIDKLIEVLSYNPKEPMIFSSGLFLLLFLGFTFIYMCLQKKLTARLLFVTAFSYYFYYKSSGIYFFLLAIVTVSDYLLAGAIYRNKEKKGLRKFLVTLSLLIDLGLLGYFKYTNFFAGMVAQMLEYNFQPWDIFLPVGISFFTFQSLSYTIDVYRGNLKPLPSILDYAFYVSFFPQLVAGPIVRASDFAPQIRKPIVITNDMFARGVYFIMIGLFKKAVISDYISLNFVDRVFDNPSLYSGLENLLGIYATPCRFIATFRATRIWPSALHFYWVFTFHSTLMPPTLPSVSPIFGVVGTSLYLLGYAIISIFRWAETAKERSDSTLTLS